MSDSLRVYLRELRAKRGLSQEKAADSIGWSSRSFNEWETGKSEDIKSRFLIRLVDLLDASWEDVVALELNEMSTEDINTLLQRRLEKRDSAPSDEELKGLVEQLWFDEDLRNAFLVFWAGWKARTSIR